MTPDRPPSDPMSRLRRFAARASSPRDLVARAAEEAVVRAWSRPGVRAAVKPFLPARQPRRWAFLAGCYNSGTTLLQSVLGAHPGIANLPREGVRFTTVLPALERDGHHMMWAEDYRDFIAPPGDPREVGRQIAADWAPFWKRGADVYLDKSIANAARIGWLEQAFPNAYFIGIHRDGRCVFESLYRRATPPDWLRERTGSEFYPVEMVARQWVTANEDMLAGLAAAKKPILLRFEDFVRDPVQELERLFAFLEVPQVPMNFSNRILTVAGRQFEIRDPNPGSLKRLGKAESDAIAPIIEPMMRRLGYGAAGS